MFKNICLIVYYTLLLGFHWQFWVSPVYQFQLIISICFRKTMVTSQQLHCSWVSTCQILCFEAFHFSSLAAIWLLTFGFMTFILFLLSSSLLISPSYVQYQFKTLPWEFIGKPLWNGHQKTSCSSTRTSLKISSSFTTMCAICVLKAL